MTQTIHSNSNITLDRFPEPGNLKLESFMDTNWESCLEEILFHYGHTGTANFETYLSDVAQKDRRKSLYRTLGLYIRARKLNSLSELSPSHVSQIFELWKADGIGPKVRANSYSHLRWFWRLFGVDLPTCSHFEEKGEESIDPPSQKKYGSWEARGISFDEMLVRFRAEDPVAACLLMAMRESGLQLREYLAAQCQNSDLPRRWDIAAGPLPKRTFGPMDATFDETGFQTFLREVRDIVGDDWFCTWQQFTIDQAYRRMQNLAEKFGLTKGALGVTLNDLKGDYVLGEYRNAIARLSALTVPGFIDFNALSNLRLKLIDMGLDAHVQKPSGLYLGRFETYDQTQLTRFVSGWNRLRGMLVVMRRQLEDEGINNLYWIGPRAFGRRCGASHPFEFLLPAETSAEKAVRASVRIAELFTSSTGIDCKLKQCEARPTDESMQWMDVSIPLFQPEAPLKAQSNW